jgi:hypothetical protein
MKESTVLPGEGRLILGRSNYDTLSPKLGGNALVMGQWPAEEAVVIVKRGAEEIVVTQLRAKHPASDKEVGDEGRNMRVVKEHH